MKRITFVNYILLESRNSSNRRRANDSENRRLVHSPIQNTSKPITAFEEYSPSQPVPQRYETVLERRRHSRREVDKSPVRSPESDKKYGFMEEEEPKIESQKPAKKVIKKGSMEALQNEHQEALDMLKELEMDIESRKEHFQELGLEKQLPFRNAQKSSNIRSSAISSSSSSAAVMSKKPKARSQSTQPAVKPTRAVNIPSKYGNKQMNEQHQQNQQMQQEQQQKQKRSAIQMERRPNKAELMAAMLPPTVPRGNDRMTQSGSLPTLVKPETRKNANVISGGPGDFSSDEEDEDGPEA